MLQLPDFEDKNKQHSISTSSSRTVLATTVHNRGLSVERPDLLEVNETTVITNDERVSLKRN